MALASRPEAPWALVVGLASGLGAAAMSVREILTTGGAVAAASFAFVPLVAVVVAVPAGLWGLALGHVWLHARGRVPSVPALLLVAWLVVLALPIIFILGSE